MHLLAQYDATVYGTGETIIPYKTDNGLYNRNVDLAYNENKVSTVLKEISQNQTSLIITDIKIF